ncbi:MAG: AAA domain-containing protein [Anaerolineae bacterium]|nr:AAA domain-containing protein [Anaerolineae bacterium]
MTTPHFQQLIDWLELEAEAEKQQALRDFQRRSPSAAEAAGGTLTNLVIRDEDAGLGGRILLTLGKRNQTLSLPWTRLGPGSPVILSEEGTRTEGWRGIVSRIQRDSIQVAFSQWPESESERPSFRLDRSSDEVSRQRQRQGLEKAAAASGSRLAELRDVLLGFRPPIFRGSDSPQPLSRFVNESQLEAVRFALSADDIAILHGPPGTGKTTTVVELIRQITKRGERVLAVAPSNIAVDNLFERLLAAGEKAIRLGHPARVLPELREHTLDQLVENDSEVKVARKLVREAHSLRDHAARFTRAKPERGARQAMRQEAKLMLADARKIEEMVIARLLDGAHIICATVTGLDRSLIGDRRFDWCIIDEANQTTEAAAWGPLQYADRLVLAGDHKQLPPTILSTQAAAQGFSISLPERLLNQLGAGISRQLTTQYRMNRAIMQFPSDELYDGSLQADALVENHLLQDLPGVAANELTATPVTFIDTAGANYEEESEPEGDSPLNPLEAELVVKKLEALLATGLPPAAIAVIAPYSAQVRLLRQLIPHSEVEVDSVDGFQGREKEAVIVSLVRSNRETEIGFLADIRRMNVALTRARRKLIVIGDSATIVAHTFYRRMVDYFEAIGAYHSVWEESDE